MSIMCASLQKSKVRMFIIRVINTGVIIKMMHLWRTLVFIQKIVVLGSPMLANEEYHQRFLCRLQFT